MREVRRPYQQKRRESWGYEHRRLAQQIRKEATMCAYAYLGGCRGPLQADHIIPRSLGGRSVKENYQALCRRHNIAKGGRNRL